MNLNAETLENTAMHLNSANTLPPVQCPLLIEIAPDRVVRAERTSWVLHRDNDLTYKICDGNEITGKFRWTYP